jgi:DNA-binding transcriptional regulator YhcF (GntR family)
MIDYILEQVNSGRFASNSRLPSLRVLMDEFNLSYGSAKRGIDYLCSRGILEKRAKSGIYVRKRNAPAEKSTPRLAIFLNTNISTSRPGVYPTVFLGIQKVAEENATSLLVNYVPVNDDAPERVSELSEGSAGVILLGEYDSAASAMKLRGPTVGVCMHNSSGGILSIIDIDPFHSAELALSFFRRKKVKKVCVVYDSRMSPAYTARGFEFSSLWHKHGGKSENASIKEIGVPEKDTGYFYTTNSLLQWHSLRLLEKTGKTLSEQAPALGIDGKNLIEPSYHKAPAIALDWQAVGLVAYEECLSRIKYPGSIPKRIYLPGKLVE